MFPFFLKAFHTWIMDKWIYLFLFHSALGLRIFFGLAGTWNVFLIKLFFMNFLKKRHSITNITHTIEPFRNKLTNNFCSLCSFNILILFGTDQFVLKFDANNVL